MAAPGATNSTVLDLALRAGAPAAAIRQAEQVLMERRECPPDVPAAVDTAMGDALDTATAPAAILRTAQAIAEAVQHHGASFPPGTEPAYHDRHHQAEAARAMGWLAGAAHRLGLLSPDQAALAVAAMAAHDLEHDGRLHAERGMLERRSADAAALIAVAQGMGAEDVASLRRIVLATTWPWADDEAPDLSSRLAREADLFASSLPCLGPRLGRRLARELAMAGQPGSEGIATHAARVALLRLMPPASAPAHLLGLDRIQAAQLAAYAGVARRLALRETSAEAAAAVLDAMDPDDAKALLAWSGTDE